MHNGAPKEKKSGEFRTPEKIFQAWECRRHPFAEIVLTVDELEAMGLSFLENLAQIEAAACMDVSPVYFSEDA